MTDRKNFEMTAEAMKAREPLEMRLSGDSEPPEKDTARIDWLERKYCTFRTYTVGEPNVAVLVYEIFNRNTDETLGEGLSLRAAIDNAMENN